MTLRIEILGANATAPTKCGPASGSLVLAGDACILVDAGPGVMGEFCRRHELSEIAAITLTHLHADHCLDLMALAYRWTFPEVLPRIPLYLPAGETHRVRDFDALFGIPTLPTMHSPIEGSFRLAETPTGSAPDAVTPALPPRLGGLKLATAAAHHAVPTACQRFELDGRVVSFTGDTSDCPSLRSGIAGSDVLVCECTYLDGDPTVLSGHGHLTATQAGRLAAETGVRHLVLNHFSTDDMHDEARRRAAEHFDGPITVAEPGLCIEV
ncbi:MBL fold metallo-hydrolase [Pseudoclavibacter sp. CFCC 11306]|uniref:MBL fold metallo-hydrolase n=1 Tax=Pseudoclavibacter sp. CFCC 11306 TaxID=1564493 RepID=UPI0013010546|nr:MBL fold metallo-hydrolase [Pseudoclavibacter sp. CFCC 11306]KAB1658833.1 MBL fold metallo-hydrolase [Pseudoclavibacter sp. CFCC 11306]